MEKLTYEYVESCVAELARIINVPNNLLPAYGIVDGGEPYILITSNDKLFLESSERGQTLWSINAANVEDLLFEVFNFITHEMAKQESEIHKYQNQDIKRFILLKKIELLGQIKKEWEEREIKYQKITVNDSMFNDYEGQKQAYFKELLGNGFLHDEALIKLKSKYPD